MDTHVLEFADPEHTRSPRHVYDKRPPGQRPAQRSDSLVCYCDKRVEDIAPAILISILFGVSFGSTSGGFFYYVLYSILLESLYAVSIRGHYTPQNTIKRLAIFCAGLLAFLSTRIVICEDTDPFRPVYHNRPSMGQIFSSVACGKPGRGNKKFGRRGKQRKMVGRSADNG